MGLRPHEWVWIPCQAYSWLLSQRRALQGDCERRAVSGVLGYLMAAVVSRFGFAEGISTAMPMVIQGSAQSTGEFIVPDAGIYTVELAEIGEPFENQRKPGTMRTAFWFKVVGGEYDGVRLAYWVNLTLHEKGNIYPAAMALLDGQFDNTKDFDLETLLGKRCQVMLDQTLADNGKTYANFLKFKPLKGGKVAPKPQPVATEDPWGDEE